MKPIQAFLYILVILVIFLGAEYYISSHKSKKLTITNPTHLSLEDTLKALDTIKQDQTILYDPVTLPSNDLECFEYPSGDTTILYPFFRMIDKIEELNSSLHLIYFGDSQIENDRITSAIRNELQSTFSGKGVGLLAIDNLYNISHRIIIETSDSWIIHSVGEESKEKIKSLLFKHSKIKDGKGWFKIKRITGKDPTDDYSLIKLFYSGSNTTNIEIRKSGQSLYSGILNAKNTIHAIQLKQETTPESLEYYFSTSDSLILSGISLESPTGIMVDNIPLRGFSFPPFDETNQRAIKEMLSLIRPSLFILGFGVNVVPSPLDDYSFYTNMLIDQIRFIQNVSPKTPILIIGVSDMSKKENGEIISYPNIKAIKKAQYKAARLCNCAFFDLESYMGGENSMNRWVHAIPELGKKDFTHFTKKGADKVGKEIGNRILFEYRKYKTTH